jgi:hypothetical protein
MCYDNKTITKTSQLETKHAITKKPNTIDCDIVECLIHDGRMSNAAVARELDTVHNFNAANDEKIIYYNT